MMFTYPKKIASASSIALLATTYVYGLAARQGGSLTSGFYTIFAISVPGFPIGAVPGPFIGVENSTDSDPSSYTFAVVDFPQGYVLNLAAGNAAPSGGNVGLVPSYPGSYWNIVPLDNGFYAIESPDGSLGWILPHDAPVGTPVSLTAPLDPLIPAEFFELNPVV